MNFKSSIPLHFFRRRGRCFSALMPPCIVCLIFFMSFSCSCLTAQDRDMAPGVFYTTSFSGNNLWNPGLKLGASYSLLYWQRPGKKEAKLRSLACNGIVGFYLDPGSHTAAYTNFGLLNRWPGKRKRSFSISLSPLGLYRSFFGETYQYTDGSVSKVALGGNLYYAPALCLACGFQTGVSPGNEIFTDLSIITLIPYNTYVMPLLTVGAGYRFGRKGGAE